MCKLRRNIIIKFLEGPKAKQTLYFLFSYYKNSTFKPEDKAITIGRQEGSVLHFPAGTLSRNQCKYFLYSKNHKRILYEEPNWVIYDGDGTKPSTNGTWLFADDYYEISDGMIFKAAETLFKACITDK